MAVLKRKLFVEGAGKSEPISKGVINGVCVSALYIGIQAAFPAKNAQYSYNACKKTGNKAIEQVLFTFEVDELVEEGPSKGKRKLVSRYVTLAYGENANLTKMYKSWFLPETVPTGKGDDVYDTDLFVGKPGQITINEKGYIENVIPLPKGVKALVPEHSEQDILDISWVQDLLAKQLQPEDIERVEVSSND